MMAGHSLGEYSALVCSGALAFADAVKLVELRGLAMQEAVPEGVGAMAAIIGLDNESIAANCEKAAQGQVVSPVALTHRVRSSSLVTRRRWNEPMC